MRQLLTTLFWPILAPFEKNGDPGGYRPSHRKALLGMGLLFLVLAAVSALIAINAGKPGALVPLLFFGAVGLVCWVVGLLGSNGAVARIWGNH